MIFSERGGAGPRSFLLLHGLGATGAAWRGVVHHLQARRLGEWTVADLPGHGGSSWSTLYSMQQMGEELAALAPHRQDLYVIGHSLGAYLALVLASGRVGVAPRAVLGVGPKIDWSDADVQTLGAFASRPVRWYANEGEALERYRRVSGLDAQLAPDAAFLERGVIQESAGFRLAQDPRSFAIAAVPFAQLAQCASCPIRLARGARDQMVTLDELRQHDHGAVELADAGHNVHVERPDACIALIERMIIER